MFLDANKIKKEMVTSNGAHAVTVQTVVGKRTYTWFSQHDKGVCKNDKLIDGSGCATCATMAVVNTFGSKYVMAPYDFRHKYQQEIIGGMSMPWSCQQCVKVLEASGLHTDYHHQSNLSTTYSLIRTHLLAGMPVIVWVWYKDVNGNVTKRYTNYAHVILLAGVTSDDKAIILDSGARGPLRIMDLMDVCRHCLPGNWLNGFILVYPQIYRVRKTWANAESQIGAYLNLENAKNAVEDARAKGETYTVYNANGVPVWPFYRVRKAWEDATGQIGAYTIYRNAAFAADLNGLNVYDNWGILLHAGSMPELPVVVALNAGTVLYDAPRGDWAGIVENSGKYTIVETANSFGKLKSGAGWINLRRANRPE